MPTLKKLADNGLLYSQWHTTALCSPTRSCFLTGRNHHQNGMACITEGAIGYPGGNAHIPPECGTLAEVMRKAGWSTFWLGKNHSVPVDDLHAGSTKETWPLHQGWDRFYGFLGGETNQWYPDLTVDNHRIDQPYQPEEGYHLSKDLADQAIQMIRDVKASAPSRPWFMWLCPGANHAPHHVPKEWADKYKGRFDDGYEAYREWVLPRMIEKGVLPEGTELSPMNPMPDGTYSPLDDVRPWDSLSADEKRLFARMAEVFAGFSEYTDHQVGRVVDYLEQTGQLDNTIVFYCADNGASGEGSPNGSVNENKFFNGWPDEMEENLKHLDDLGSPNTYNHYPTGWAMAFSTPFRMFKRYSYQGGVCDPMVVHWPKGIKARGEVRHQYHHAIDVVPTILECCGLEFPETLNGHEQVPLPGNSMRYSFDDADAPPTKERQYYAMLGTRGIWEHGWKAVAVHGPTSGIGNFDKDEWQLFHTDEDRAEAHDLAAGAPGEAEAADRRLVRGGGEVRRAAARRPAPARDPGGSAAAARAAARHVRLLPGHGRGAGVGRGQHALPLVQDPRRGRAHEPRRRGRDLRPRLALRRARALPQGAEALVRLQLPRRRRPSSSSSRTGSSPASTSSAWSSRRRAPASTARRSARRSCT